MRRARDEARELLLETFEVLVLDLALLGGATAAALGGATAAAGGGSADGAADTVEVSGLAFVDALIASLPVPDMALRLAMAKARPLNPLALACCVMLSPVLRQYLKLAA
ncbi:MAG: hypothetical protein ABW076_01315 [Candidatus Thiodiazotropha sp.]